MWKTWPSFRVVKCFFCHLCTNRKNINIATRNSQTHTLSTNKRVDIVLPVLNYFSSSLVSYLWLVPMVIEDYYTICAKSLHHSLLLPGSLFYLHAYFPPVSLNAWGHTKHKTHTLDCGHARTVTHKPSQSCWWDDLNNSFWELCDDSDFETAVL